MPRKLIKWSLIGLGVAVLTTAVAATPAVAATRPTTPSKVLAATTGTLTAGPALAGAVTGIVKINGPTSPIDSQPSKTVQATCPAGKRVIGGGGWANPLVTADATRVGLTELRPVHPASGADSYVVTAQETTPNITTNWWVQAFAICANPVAGLHIVSDTSFSQDEVQVFCPAGESVLGSGGKVNNPGNRVKLTMVSPLSDIRVRVSAAEDGVAGVSDWTTSVYAVCAPTPPGLQLVFAQSSAAPSEALQVAFINCPAGTRLYGAAGLVQPAIGADPSGLALQVIYPSNALDQVEAVAVETRPTDTNWVVKAVAICAN